MIPALMRMKIEVVAGVEAEVVEEIVEAERDEAEAKAEADTEGSVKTRKKTPKSALNLDDTRKKIRTPKEKKREKKVRRLKKIGVLKNRDLEIRLSQKNRPHRKDEILINNLAASYRGMKLN